MWHQYIRKTEIWICTFTVCQQSLIECRYNQPILHPISLCGNNQVKGKKERALRPFLKLFTITNAWWGHFTSLIWIWKSKRQNIVPIKTKSMNFYINCLKRVHAHTQFIINIHHQSLNIITVVMSLMLDHLHALHTAGSEVAQCLPKSKHLELVFIC